MKKNKGCQWCKFYGGLNRCKFDQKVFRYDYLTGEKLWVGRGYCHEKNHDCECKDFKFSLFNIFRVA